MRVYHKRKIYLTCDHEPSETRGGRFCIAEAKWWVKVEGKMHPRCGLHARVDGHAAPKRIAITKEEREKPK